MRRERLTRPVSDKQISCELTLKSRFSADAHVCVSYQKKGPDYSSPVFLLAKRCLEDRYQCVVLALSQRMTFRIDELQAAAVI
ncbi:hypothetical protein AAW06_11465 [Escherichia coli]|nr:hypothetical protein AAW06_11465 [Escherichia coli]